MPFENKHTVQSDPYPIQKADYRSGSEKKSTPASSQRHGSKSLRYTNWAKSWAKPKTNQGPKKSQKAIHDNSCERLSVTENFPCELEANAP